MFKWLGKNYLQVAFYLLIFLFIWQARLFLFQAEINNEFWEWGSISLYGTELYLFFVFFLTLWSKRKELKKKEFYLALWKKYYFFLSFWLVFEILILTSTFFATLPYLSFYGAWRFFEVLILFFIVANIDFDYIYFNIVIVASAVLETALALYQWFAQKNIFVSKWLGLSELDPVKSGTSVIEYAKYAVTKLGDGVFWSRWLRAYGSFPHPNILAGFLLLAVFLALGLYLNEYYGWLKLFASLIAVFVFVGLLLAFSRSAWLAFILLFLLLIFFIYLFDAKTERDLEWQSDQRFAIIKYIILLVAITASFVAVYPEVFYTRTHLETRLEEYSYKDRLWQYKYVFSVIKKHPLFGTGMYNYTLFLPNTNINLHLEKDGGLINVGNDLMPLAPRKAINYQPVHNLYLLIWGELGFLALLVFLTFILYLLAKILAVYKLLTRDMLLLTYFLVFLALLLTALFDHYWWTIWSMMMYFYLMIFVLIKRYYYSQNHFSKDLK